MFYVHFFLDFELLLIIRYSWTKSYIIFLHNIVREVRTKIYSLYACMKALPTLIGIIEHISLNVRTSLTMFCENIQDDFKLPSKLKFVTIVLYNNT